MPDKENFWALSEKEKQTLRLIVRGHDAKSMARSLGLSVHTVNERLRDARRKMAVSSSREAARLLLEAEIGDGVGISSKSVGHVIFGDGTIVSPTDQGGAPVRGAKRSFRYPLIAGAIVMTLTLGLLAFAGISNVGFNSLPSPAKQDRTPDAEVVEFARAWLNSIDERQWSDSYRATNSFFRKANTLQLWKATSERARAPLGAIVTRTLISQENFAAPPNGYEVVRFRTTFSNKANVLETVTLEREDGEWRVAGVTME